MNLNELNIADKRICAASSLLNVDGNIYLCCDDQYGLYQLNELNKWNLLEWGDAPKLPENHIERKKLKPDFEVLIGGFRNEYSILLMPSGSKKNRYQGLVYNSMENTFLNLDLTNLFESIGMQVRNVNIEGGVIYKNQIIFLNRGIGKSPSSLIILDKDSLNINTIKFVKLGNVNNIELHGSELCIYKDYLYALVVGEDAENSYDDGIISGSGISKISLETFEVIDSWIFDLPVKTEGLCRYKNNWLVTTDPDGNGASQFFTFNLE